MITITSQISMMVMNGITDLTMVPKATLKAAMATIRFRPTGGVR